MKTNSKLPRQGAFTLVEIMIVVLIIGILLAIAIPNFVTARNSSRSKACVANLKQIDSAKQQYIMDKRLTSATSPTAANLAPTYIRAFPACPASGTYTIGDGNSNPTCNFVDATYPHQLT
ncbi:MAG TPA: prepilin-type N-terminal cleavage/methylation domain-containing protein [Capsulimonadaceae bacterium]